MTLLFTCRKCGLQAPTLEGHRCVAPTVELDIPATAGERVARQERARARAVLAQASERVGAKEAFREAAIAGQAFVRDGRLLKSEEVLAPTKDEPRFDRAAYHKAYMKAYMRAYMRGWRARKRRAGP